MWPRICLWLALGLVAEPAQGQWMERLPTVIPPDSLLARHNPPLEELPTSMRAVPASYFDPNIQQAPPQTPPLDEPVGPQLPPGAKSGVLQRVTFANSWLSGSEPDDLEIFETELSVSLGFPFPTVQTPLVLTPGVGLHLFDGPDMPDLPPRVYDAYLDILWKHYLTETFTLDVAVTPGWYSDLEQSNSDALRIGGRVIGKYAWTPVTKFILGGVYLDRDDVPFLPIAGVVWTPSDDLRLELVFPKPRVEWRSWVNGEYSSWWYVAGEFGGGTWAIERANGLPDVVNYSDLRISIGQEWKRGNDSIGFIDIGYVFERELSYDSGTTADFEPSDTIMIRAGLGY